MGLLAPYTLPLTIVMGIAMTIAVQGAGALLATGDGLGSDLDPNAVFVRFAIFVLLSIRWTVISLWYLQVTYNPDPEKRVQSRYLVDVLVMFVSFLLFVPLANNVVDFEPSLLSQNLDTRFAGSRQVSTFIWVLALLLLYNLNYALRGAPEEG